MITWTDNGSSRIGEGYGDASYHLTKHISKSGLDFCKIENESPQEISGLQIGYARRNDIYEGVVINHCLPESYGRHGDYKIGFTYWETNKLPDSWLDDLNRMDEVWTTSDFMRSVFINSGVVKPVYNFQLGVDPAIYSPLKRVRKSPFTFLSIGSPSTRKNSQVAVDAFIKLFSGDDGYRMIYKSKGPPDARSYNGGMKGRLNHPQIDIIDWEVSAEELGRIYDKADCLLYPTSGEGWGLLPFQAIAKGIPTICTNFSACSEFAHFSVPLDYSISDYKMSGTYENTGYWAKPDFDDLCDKMLYTVNNYEEISNRTYMSALYIKENMTWEKVSERYVDRLCQILK
jgi:glycosyltransferase involved in cell wall biosynthesis